MEPPKSKGAGAPALLRALVAQLRSATIDPDSTLVCLVRGKTPKTKTETIESIRVANVSAENGENEI